MIRELHGLKVKAIACEVPEQYECYSVVGNTLHFWLEHLSPFKREVVLPPGSWKILKRASEIDGLDAIDLMKFGLLKMPPLDILEGIALRGWRMYCSENGLTNELILTPNERS